MGQAPPFDVPGCARFPLFLQKYVGILTIEQEITCFSYDDEHQFHLGEPSLRYYYPPSLPADLNRGFDTFQKLDDAADEHLDALLETIIAHEKETGKKCETDIITWRGMMTKVSSRTIDQYLCGSLL